jgi:hypothetical protein
MERRTRIGPVKPTYRRLDVEEAPPDPPPTERAEPSGPILLDPLPPPPDPGMSRDRREERVRRFLITRGRAAPLPEPPAAPPSAPE